MKTKIGTFLAIAWSCFLIVAFAYHPKPDNLVTGYIIYVLFGADALGKISMATAIVIGIAQIAICFLFGYFIGTAIQLIQEARK